MANPQPDEFTRISNELFEAIMFSNFTKRQMNILNLVIRLSYGCGKKFALLKKSDFEVVGVYKTHIKRELDYLEAAKVIQIDGDQISLNKNYDEWRINLVYSIDQGKYKKILSKNLQQKVTKTVTSEEEKVTKTVTDELPKRELLGYQNSNQEVTKTVTDQALEPNGDASSGACKEILKKIKENIKEPPPYNPPPGGSVSDKKNNKKFRKRESAKTAPVVTPLNSVDEGPGLADRTGEKAMGETPQEKTTAPTVGKAPGYDQGFLEFWDAYPRKAEKQRAYRCWKTRIREGLSEGLTMEDLVSDLVTTAKNYAADCRKQRTEERYIKHASTFLGPDKPYLDWISKPVKSKYSIPDDFYWDSSELEKKEVKSNANGNADTGKPKSKYSIPDDFYWSE